ncbi:MAG TPA: kelch repeat-containing protein, partial [Polyangiaceae bacterium]|nr:kelch repeat-containing protein [Polyangiaceae bacterium]
PNGRVLVAGGATVVTSSTTGYLTSASIYDPGTNRWFATGNMNVGRAFATMTVLDDGTVLVVGGQGTGAVALSSAELYDPATGVWNLLPWQLQTSRYNHRAILLGSGKVLVTGGQNSLGSTASAEIYDPSTQQWTAAQSMNKVRSFETATVLQGGSILVTGGTPAASSTSAEIYDPVANTWTLITNPMTGTGRANHTATLLGDGTVLLTGGRVTTTLATSEIFTLNTTTPASSTFALTIGSLGVARYNHTDTLLADGTVMVTGGQTASSLNATEIYDPTAQTWTRVTTGDLATGRWLHHMVTLASGKIMVVGGQGQSNSTLSAEIYDKTSSTWSPAGGMGGGRWDHTSTLLSDGRILVAGGQGAAVFGVPALRSAFIYDPSNKTWTRTGDMTTARAQFSATLLASGDVLVAGGNTAPSGGTAWLTTAEVWNHTTGAWTATTNTMSDSHGLQTATLLASGKVLVAGGVDSTTTTNGLSTAAADIYDPSTNSWTATQSLATARHQHTATLLSDGTVLVTGGSTKTSGGTTILSSAEVFDPTSGTWSAGTSLATARSSHTATLLSGGKILIAGGGTTGLQATQTAELYTPGGSTPPTIGMMVARSGHGAALLKDGRVLLVAGTTVINSTSSATATAEIYDPKQNTFGKFTSTGSLLTGRTSTTIVLVPSDGTVEAIGGIGADALTETWHP